MSQAVARTRVESSRPRSSSISDSLIWQTPESISLGFDGAKSNEVYTQDLSGVFLKRVPLVEADFDNNQTIPSYQYHLENKRPYPVRVTMTFDGQNTKVMAANSGFSKPNINTVEGQIAPSSSVPFALLEAADKSRDFTFKADVKIYPVQDDLKEIELEGVKFYTKIDYSGTTAIMSFEAYNTKDFDVEVELTLKGQIKDQSGSLPFRRIVGVGQRQLVGKITSDHEVETHWKWTGVHADTENPRQPHIQTSELKGVTLRQTLEAGNPTKIKFDVVNTRSKKVRVEIDMFGDGEIDFRGQARPIVGSVPAGQTAFMGIVNIKGDAEVNWKFKEEAD